MSLPSNPGPAREAAILNAVRNGEHEPIQWSPIRSMARGYTAELYVAHDALKIDSVRVNITATTAQQIADLLGASLPTSRICDLAWEQATVRCKPCIQKPSPNMASTYAMETHSRAVDDQVAGRRGLVRTVGKDWILHHRLTSDPDLAVNYGWHDPRAPHLSWSGLHLWQPLGTRHNRHHTDYSEVLCLVKSTMRVNGEDMPLIDVMRHAEMSWLVNDDGAMSVTRYPGVSPLEPLAERGSPFEPIESAAANKPPISMVQSRNFTHGRPGGVDLVVIHSMEASEKPDTAERVAAWFAGPNAPRASCHYCVDADSIVQCVAEGDTAWHAPGANHNGIGIEHAGFAKQSAADWSDDYSRAMLCLSSQLVADICQRHSIPMDYVDAVGLKAGKRGITTHRDVSAAFKRSNHWDPGPGFPMAQFVSMVRSSSQ